MTNSRTKKTCLFEPIIDHLSVFFYVNNDYWKVLKKSFTVREFYVFYTFWQKNLKNVYIFGPLCGAESRKDSRVYK